MTTIWTARRVGDRILCGQAGCGDILALVPADVEPYEGRVALLFLDYYVPVDLPHGTRWRAENGEDTTVLLLSTYVEKQLERGQKPRRRDPGLVTAATVDNFGWLQWAEDGSTFPVRPWPLPVVLPCLHHHVNRVDNPTPDGVE